MDSHSKRKRIRRVLRDTTHYKNTTEFFTAVLFECGLPPHPLKKDLDGTFSPMPAVAGDYDAWKKGVAWRNKLATHMSERLHHSIDPTFMVQEYFKWILRQQENGRLSVH